MNYIFIILQFYYLCSKAIIKRVSLQILQAKGFEGEHIYIHIYVVI